MELIPLILLQQREIFFSSFFSSYLFVVHLFLIYFFLISFSQFFFCLGQMISLLFFSIANGTTKPKLHTCSSVWQWQEYCLWYSTRIHTTPVFLCFLLLFCWCCCLFLTRLKMCLWVLFYKLVLSFFFSFSMKCSLWWLKEKNGNKFLSHNFNLSLKTNCFFLYRKF